MSGKNLLFGLAILLMGSCSEQEVGFAEERIDLLLEFPPTDQALAENGKGAALFQMSGSIENISEEGASVPDLRVVGRDYRERFVFKKDIDLQVGSLAAGQTLHVDEAIEVPEDAKIFEIGWAREEVPG